MIKILLYFDIFSYPLTRREIISYSGLGRERWYEVDRVLDDLEKKGVISLFGGLYYIGNQKSKVIRRIEENHRAAKKLKRSSRFSRIISHLPFVRGILISGSLSKDFKIEEDNIDYLIITNPGRLWLVRTLLEIFKKIFLFNRHKIFSTNYFVDTDHLNINEHNRYTATEIVFLIPVFNWEMYNTFLMKNSWVKSYYPNFNPRHDLCHEENPQFKKWLEKILDNFLVDRLESYFYNVSKANIRKKYSHLDQESLSASFRLLRHELRLRSNHQHPNIQKRHHSSILKFQQRTGMAISSDFLAKSEG